MTDAASSPNAPSTTPTADRPARSSSGTPLGSVVASVLSGRARRDRDAPRELDALPLPDLLTPEPGGTGPDTEFLLEQMDLAFLGRASAGELDAEIGRLPVPESPFRAEHFGGDLFVDELVRDVLTLTRRNRRVPVHRAFLRRFLCSPSADAETVAFRQAILRDLDQHEELATGLDRLHEEIAALLHLLRASRDDARLEPVRFRLDVLRAFRTVVTRMDEAFGDAASGLVRLHSFARRLGASEPYRRMTDLLDHDEAMARLRMEVVLGSDGRIRHLQIGGVRELKANRFYRNPLRRWFDRLRILWRGYSLRPGEVADRLVNAIYHEVAPAMARVLQLVAHLEVYLTARCFARDAASRGLPTCLPEIDDRHRLDLEGLFNPLLLPLMNAPVPTDLRLGDRAPVAVVTGPNSGGKTRLLQAVGLTQLLAQSGLYVPCRSASMRLVPGLFASIVELDRADQREGRLGTELVRLRTLFETVPPGALVLLDELCSGTNPSEAIEIVDMVLRLLGRLNPLALVTTHFLDFAQELSLNGGGEHLSFLQAEVDDSEGATYRFVPGVAATSLAVGTARRLGVAFDDLERGLEERVGHEPGE